MSSRPSPLTYSVFLRSEKSGGIYNDVVLSKRHSIEYRSDSGLELAMSTDGQGRSGDAGGDKQQQGFSKFMRRASKVLRSNPNKGIALADASGSSPISPGRSEPVSIQPAVSKAPSTRLAVQPPKQLLSQPSELAVQNIPTTAHAYNKLQEEKARALFAKYGMTLEPGEWTPVWKGDAGRVERTVRMRVHRQCHRCQSTFGSEKICNNCSHTRCKKCPRFPQKMAKEPGTKAATTGTMPTVAVSAPTPASRSRVKSLTLPEQLTGNEVVRKIPVHRVRRTCHKCETVFMGKATECATCKHLRCPRCPREPYVLIEKPIQSLANILTGPSSTNTLTATQGMWKRRLHLLNVNSGLYVPAYDGNVTSV